jgi:hypothetical protein
METFKSSYCDKFREAVPTRTEFVKKIKPLSGTDFDTACLNELSENPQINVWFNPIDPMVSISSTQICDLHRKLFASL